MQSRRIGPLWDANALRAIARYDSDSQIGLCPSNVKAAARAAAVVETYGELRFRQTGVRLIAPLDVVPGGNSRLRPCRVIDAGKDFPYV